MLRTGLLPTDSMYKGALSSGGREFSGMDIYYGHSVPEGYRMNPRLFYFQIKVELKGKSKRLTQAASNKAFTNKPSQNKYLGLCVNCKFKRIV